MSGRATQPESIPDATGLLLLLAVAKAALHFATIANYGYFRDELYYLACADHLAWGYVDHPPFSIAVLAVTRSLLGDSLLAIRLPVVLAGALTVVLTGRLARQLGGGRFAQVLAALTFVFMPVALGMATFYSMNALDLLFWLAAVYVLVLVINTGNARLWVALGVIVSGRRGWGWLRPAVVGLVTLVGIVAVPLAVPILPPESVVRYASAIGVEAPQEERQRRVALAQHFADRFGWQNMVATVARVYQALPAAERAHTAIVGGNYGEAGAIDFFGRRYGLPPAISGHNSYWLWGPGNAAGEVVIVIGAPREQLEQLFEDVTQADTVVSDYAMAYETNLPVYVCRRLKRPLAEVWPALKRYI